MNYNFLFKKNAEKFLAKQNMDTRNRILKAIKKLPFGDVKKLIGYDNLSRLRVGDFRIIFKTDDERLEITITNIGSRGDIY